MTDQEIWDILKVKIITMMIILMMVVGIMTDQEIKDILKVEIMTITD